MDGQTNPLVSSKWLADNTGAANLVILDASLHLPAADRDAFAEYRKQHIPGARFLDLKRLVDTRSDVPSAHPRPDQLADYLGELGVSLDSKVVIYDDSAVKTAARAWFLLRAHGLTDVAILDGGLGKWRADGFPLSSGEERIEPVSPPALQSPANIRYKSEILANLDSRSEQVLDARGADRVFGEGVDPVHGGLNGRIPGSFNLPFTELYSDDGTYKSVEQLRAAFEQAGIDLEQPVISTCGSGVTACVLLFALELIGKSGATLYDGSWVDWSSDPDTPKESGPA